MIEHGSYRETILEELQFDERFRNYGEDFFFPDDNGEESKDLSD